jgi:hypothetical protein
MRTTLLLLLLFTVANAGPPVFSRLQPEFICWESDMEFPVDCGDDD